MAKSEAKGKLTPDDIKKLEVMSAIRLPMEHMASILGFGSKQTLERRLKRNAAARDAIERGRSNASNKARLTLFRSGTENQEVIEETEEFVLDPTDKEGKRKIPGVRRKRTIKGPDTNALKFWLETQEGFKRTEKLELAKASAVDAEFEDLSEEQILERIAKMKRVTKSE